MNKVAISTECVCDLPATLLVQSKVEVIYFDVITDRGVFQDTTEITDKNVIEYMRNGDKKALSEEASVQGYVEFFEKQLKENVDVIHISITSKNSVAVNRATTAKKMMGYKGEHVHVIDSKTLSSGMGHIVLKAVELRDAGLEVEEIIKQLEEFIPRVCTSFVALNADYLYYNGRIGKGVMLLCRKLNMHPVLRMKKGELSLWYILVGNYRKCCAFYVKRLLNKRRKIETKRATMTHAGCTVEQVNKVLQLAASRVQFDEVITHAASASVSCNCGPGIFGIIFVRQEKNK